MVHSYHKPPSASFLPFPSLALSHLPSPTSYVTASPSTSPSPTPRRAILSPPETMHARSLSVGQSARLNNSAPLSSSRVLSIPRSSEPYSAPNTGPPTKISQICTAPEPVQFSDPQGYIPILPRTISPSAHYKKRCETCATEHDGSFGAGRFCSSRCARTVGGLAHRRKRMQERDARQKYCSLPSSTIAIHPMHNIMKTRLPPRHENSRSNNPPIIVEEHNGWSSQIPLSTPYMDSFSTRRAPRTAAMSINSLLNPS